MCTILLAHRHFEGIPLAVGANRDEVKSRAATGPFRWPQGFFAPQDLEALGTWLGVTRSGLFVGVTNRFASPKQALATSRGLLVCQALQSTTAEQLRGVMTQVNATQFNAFHLLYADADAAYISWSDGQTLHQSLEAGLHVLTEQSFQSTPETRGAEAKTRLATSGTPLQRFAPALKSATVNFPPFNYGTRSSAVYWRTASAQQFWWAEGGPHQPFTPLSLDDATRPSLTQTPQTR
jgi:uncharacterized protein with NRDE domain